MLFDKENQSDNGRRIRDVAGGPLLRFTTVDDASEEKMKEEGL